MSCQHIAEQINAYLKRFEDDPEINRYPEDHPNAKAGVSRYWNAAASVTGNGRVRVCYISYQGASTLTKREALAYLAWLDAGNVGRHYEALRDG